MDISARSSSLPQFVQKAACSGFSQAQLSHLITSTWPFNRDRDDVVDHDIRPWYPYLHRNRFMANVTVTDHRIFHIHPRQATPQGQKRMPSRTKKRHFTIIIFMLLLLSLGALGCGGHQKQTQEPSLSFKITNAQSGPLDTVEDLVANQDFEAASQHLKAVDIGMTSVQDRDRLAYLTARIALAQHPKSGCKLLAKYAQTTTHPQRKTVATQLALRCLVAPNACSQIKAISKDLCIFIKKNKNSTRTPGYLHIGPIKTCAIDFP